MKQYTRVLTLALVAVGLALGTSGSPAQAEDTSQADQELLAVDSDGDGFLDYQELLAGSDPFDAESIPDAAPKVKEQAKRGIVAQSGVPSPACRAGFQPIGTLCIDNVVQSPDHFANVLFYCQNRRARVATYGDLYYVYWTAIHLRAQYNPDGKWIGPGLISDDHALCGNRVVDRNPDSDVFNFEGTCHKFDSRAYWCVHDLQ
jgi:hypothetical protein